MVLYPMPVDDLRRRVVGAAVDLEQALAVAAEQVVVVLLAGALVAGSGARYALKSSAAPGSVGIPMEKIRASRRHARPIR